MQLPLAQIIPSEAPPLSTHTIDSQSNVIATVCPSLEQPTIYVLSEPHKTKIPLTYAGSPVSRAHTLGTTNLVLLVLQNDKKNRILLWDDKQGQVVVTLTFRHEVRGLVTRHDRLVIVHHNKIVLFCMDLYASKGGNIFIREGEYDTCDNPSGLASIATTAGSSLLAFPGRQPGHVQMIRLPTLVPTTSKPSSPASTSTPPYPSIHIFVAHTTALRTLTLSASGSLLATSSAKGTLIRIFDTTSHNLVRELRRGSDQADVWSVAFSDQERGGIVACSSDKGTVHIWHVGNLITTRGATPRRERTVSSESRERSLSILKPYLPAYFSSQWSDLSWRIPTAISIATINNHSYAQDDVAVCVFTAHTEEDAQFQDLLVITRSGGWFRLSTSPKASEKGKQKAASSDRSTNEPSTKEDEKQARLLEYRRFGPQPDGGDMFSDASDDDLR